MSEGGQSLDGTDCLADDLRDLIATLERRAQEVDEMGRATDIANAHANGVSCGLRFARDEVGQVLKNDCHNQSQDTNTDHS